MAAVAGVFALAGVAGGGGGSSSDDEDEDSADNQDAQPAAMDLEVASVDEDDAEKDDVAEDTAALEADMDQAEASDEEMSQEEFAALFVEEGGEQPADAATYQDGTAVMADPDMVYDAGFTAQDTAWDDNAQTDVII
jgi:hypothetical protein